MNRSQPVRTPIVGTEYTLDFILKNLELDDMPCLLVPVDYLSYPIQQSHLTEKEMLEIPGMAKTVWKYRGTTNEWVPVFDAVDKESVLKCVDINNTDQDGYWITPKGYPRNINE